MAMQPAPVPLSAAYPAAIPRVRKSCCADWGDHWRYMGQEFKALGREIVTHPGRSLRDLFFSPLTVSLYWFLITLYFNSVLSIESERQGNDHNPILVDEGFKKLGGFIDAFDLPNDLLYGTVGATALRFLPIWPCVKPAMFRMIARRWLALEGVIFFFRGFSVAMTSVPQPNPECVITATGSVWTEAFNIIFGVTNTCGDCMFSGHTACITLCILFWTHYSRGEELSVLTGRCKGIITSNVDAVGDPMGWKLIDFPLWAYAIVCYYLIIRTQFHYSHDDFMGFLVTYYLFRYYHMYLKALPQRSGSFGSRFMRWFEGINLAQDALAKEQALVANGTAAGLSKGQTNVDADGVIQGGNAVTQQSSLAAAEAVKDNTILGSAPPVSLLPASYLEGREYYRADRPDAGDLYRGTGASKQNKELQQQRHSPRASLNGVTTADAQRWENTAEMAPVRVHHGIDEQPQRHNFLQPGGIAVITTREQAGQERRETERETGVNLS